MENEFKKSKWVLAIFLFVLVTSYFIVATPVVNAALPCGADYSECNIDFGGVNKGICLAGLCGSTESSNSLKRKYDSAKTDCANVASKNECVLSKVLPVQNGFGDLIGFACAVKDVYTSCTVSSCVQNPVGAAFSGCTNTGEKCDYPPGSTSFPSCVANTACPDTDKDGIPACWGPGQYTKWDTPSPPPKKDPSRFSDDSGVGDCDDKDRYSYGYSSANIASVSVVDSTGVKKNIPVGDFSLLDSITITVNFKKKCGHTTPTPPSVPLYVFLVFSSTDEKTLSGSSPTTFVKKSDFVYTATFGLNTILTEEAIAAVAKNPKPKLKFLGADEFTSTPLDKPFNDPILPMTNCAQTYGSGRHKVVYMRDQTGLYGQTLDHSRVALSGFQTVEPFKTYQSEFSHFVDLKKPLLWFKAVDSFDENSLTLLSMDSSCGRWNWMYFGIFTDPSRSASSGNGWTYRGKNAAIIEYAGYDKFEQYKYIHEMGHSVAMLADEYYDLSREITLTNLSEMKEQTIPHCSLDPKTDWTVNGILYGGTTFESCTFKGFDPSLPRNFGFKKPPIFRPSKTSIMRTDFFSEPNPVNPYYFQFNVISCARLLQAIKHSGSWKGELAECAKMPGIVPAGA